MHGHLVTCVKDGIIHGDTVLLKLAHGRDEGADIHDVPRHVAEVYGHAVVTVYHVNHAHFTADVAVVVAYLRHIHFGGIWHPGAVNKDSGHSRIAINVGKIFLKKRALDFLAPQFFQHPADVLAGKVGTRDVRYA